MFGYDQRDRLLRESWDADGLAQELYAMFSPDVPANTNGAVSITAAPGDTVAPLQITTPDSGQVLSATTPNGTTYDLSFGDNGLQQSTDGGTPQPVGSGGGGGGKATPVWG